MIFIFLALKQTSRSKQEGGNAAISPSLLPSSLQPLPSCRCIRRPPYNLISFSGGGGTGISIISKSSRKIIHTGCCHMQSRPYPLSDTELASGQTLNSYSGTFSEPHRHLSPRSSTIYLSHGGPGCRRPGHRGIIAVFLDWPASE